MRTNTLRKHKLMTKELERKMPPLRSTEEQGADALVHIHFFSPYSQWDWYATEYDPATGVFFGWVNGFEGEYGYFTLAELENATGKYGLPLVERDLDWTPVRLAEVK